MASTENMNAQLPPKRVEALPDSGTPNGPCPRCGRVSHFSLNSQTPVTFDGTEFTDHGEQRSPVEQASVLECHACQQRIVVIEEEVAEAGNRYWRGHHWWPTPGMLPLNPDIPAAVADEVAEGTRCLAVRAPRAAVVMFRGALAEVVHDRGSAAAKSKSNLAGQLKQMADEGALVATLADWADHIRVLGNAGAHPSTLAPVSMPEAEELLRLVNSLLEYLYVMPARVQRARASRP